MAREPQQPQQDQEPPVVDPDRVPEVICDGQINVSATGNLATLTFTDVRPDAAAMFQGTINPTAVVRARIVTTLSNLEALRELLNSMVVQSPEVPAPPAGGTTKH